MARIWRVNLSTSEFVLEDVKDEYKFLGGRGLTSKIIANEVNPQCDPLSEDNKLVFAPGLLSGTGATDSGRNSCGA